MSGQLELDELFTTILDQVTKLMDADRGTLWLVDQDKRELWSKVTGGAEPIRIPITSGLVGEAVGKGDVIRIADAYEDNRFHPAVDRQSGYKTKSVLVVPIRNASNIRLSNSKNSGGLPTAYQEVIGAVQMLNKRNEGVFSEVDEDLLRSVCRNMGNAIQHWAQNKDAQEGMREALIGMKTLEKQLGDSKSQNHDLVRILGR